MPRKTRRTFLTTTAPALALAAPGLGATAEAAAAGAGQAAAQASVKKVYRTITPTSKTFNGQPLYSPELSFGNMVFVSGKGPGSGFKGGHQGPDQERARPDRGVAQAGRLVDGQGAQGQRLPDRHERLRRHERVLPGAVRVAAAGPDHGRVVSIPDGTLVEIDCIAAL